MVILSSTSTLVAVHVYFYLYDVTRIDDINRIDDVSRIYDASSTIFCPFNLKAKLEEKGIEKKHEISLYIRYYGCFFIFSLSQLLL